MGGLTLSGVTARLCWGYHSAATLGAWRVSRTDAGPAVLTAAIVSLDPLRASQRPLMVVAPHAHGAWRWPVVSLEVTGASLTAVLGPKEK